MKALVLVSCPRSHSQEERILALADWMGVPARKITLGERPSTDAIAEELGAGECVAVSVETLAFLREFASPDVLQDLIARCCSELLVFSVGGSQQHRDTLTWLTNGAVSGLGPAEERRVFRIPDSTRPLSRAFAGQSFTMKRAVVLSGFEVESAGSLDLEKILLADEGPVFVRMKRGSCELFLLAVDQLADISEQLSPTEGVQEHFDRVIPLLIFLRHCFGEVCWHGVGSAARLIIDDPLLVQTYGFLDYRALRNSMHSVGYGTSIAFIPWNHWRTSKKKAAALIAQESNLSICVHGCDHTNKEFSEEDLDALQWKAATGLRRMERHRSRTGVAFDPVMIFPQGKFSSLAMSALHTSGYLAAVNTTCFPTNADAQPLTIADFLRPAITKFHGFPLFQRRHPRRLIDFAFDIFLGRPALIVQHHDDFREGYRQLEEFVEGLYGIEPKLTWGALSSTLMRSCMMRQRSERSTEVRFFTREFSFTNTRSNGADFTFSKEQPDTSAIASVLVDGTDVPFFCKDDLLTFECRVDAGQTIDVRIQDKPAARGPQLRTLGVRHTIRVSARRALSEFRDNVLAKHPGLLAAGTRVAARMKLTGTSGVE